MNNPDQTHNSEPLVADMQPPLALDLPDEPFYICSQGTEPLPLAEIPESLEGILQGKALTIGYRRRAKPDIQNYLRFEEWELLHIHRGHLPIPYWMMEKARTLEKFGRPSPEYDAEFNGRLDDLYADHLAWGFVQFYNLWPKTGRPNESWFKLYEKIKAEGYGDLWYASDYSSLPLIDPFAAFLPEEDDEPDAPPKKRGWWRRRAASTDSR